MNWIALLAVLGTQDESSFKPARGVYEFRIGGDLAGVETVEFTADGWKAKGKCDKLQILQAEYEAELSRDKDGTIRWKLDWKRDKIEAKVEAELKDGKATVRTNGSDLSRRTSLSRTNSATTRWTFPRRSPISTT